MPFPSSGLMQVKEVNAISIIWDDASEGSKSISIIWEDDRSFLHFDDGISVHKTATTAFFLNCTLCMCVCCYPLPAREKNGNYIFLRKMAPPNS